MNYLADTRRRLGWTVHCLKAIFRSYHYQLLPLFDIIIRPGDLVIDVGAHAGQFSKIFAERTPDGLVLAVEPSSYPYFILRVVKFIRRMHPVKIIKAGVSVQQGEAVLQTPVKESGVVKFGLSRISDDNMEKPGGPIISETIPVTTIDLLVNQLASDMRLSLLKADIEGYEYEMLCGGEHSIEKYKPCLLLEVSVNRKEILDFLWQRDYAVFGLLNYSGKSRELLRLKRIRELENNQPRNILAVHNSNEDVLGKVEAAFC